MSVGRGGPMCFLEFRPLSRVVEARQALSFLSTSETQRRGEVLLPWILPVL